MEHILISNLVPGDDSERLCVRLSRLWNFCDVKDESKIFNTNLVLLDKKVR